MTRRPLLLAAVALLTFTAFLAGYHLLYRA